MRPEYAHVTYDPAWEKFIAFLRDMGVRPPGTTLDRRDNAKGYFKENCRWATPVEQTHNRGIAIYATFQGRRMHITEIAALTGKTWRSLNHRHAQGTLQRYLDEGNFIVRRVCTGFLNGEVLPIHEISRRTGIHYQTLHKWYVKGIIDEKLVTHLRSSSA